MESEAAPPVETTEVVETVQESAPVETTEAAEPSEPAWSWDSWDGDDFEVLKDEWREPARKTAEVYSKRYEAELERTRSILSAYQEGAVPLSEFHTVQAAQREFAEKYAAMEKQYNEAMAQVAREEMAAVQRSMAEVETRRSGDIERHREEIDDILTAVMESNADSFDLELVIDVATLPEQQRTMLKNLMVKNVGDETIRGLMQTFKSQVAPPPAPVMAQRAPVIVPPPPAPKAGPPNVLDVLGKYLRKTS